MLSEALQYLVGLGQQARAVEVIKVGAFPDHVFVRVGSELQKLDAPPDRRNHHVGGMADFIEGVQSMARQESAAQVFVSEKEIVALLDANDRRDRITLSLQTTTRFARARLLEAQPYSFEPRAAVKFLRLEMHSANVEPIIQSLRRLDFQRTSSGRSAVEHGRESLGKSVEAVVQQAGDIPESFSIIVPIWSNQGAQKQATIDVGVFLDLEAQKVELRVLADEIARVLVQGTNALAADLREALPQSQVYVGTP